jgi:putative endonuclease
MHYYIYILTNKNNNVLYTGVTNNLIRRVHEHKNKLAEGFTKKYNVNKLVYYEIASNPQSAIAREKQIKGMVRKKKIALINKMNPEWKDLWEEIAVL